MYYYFVAFAKPLPICLVLLWILLAIMWRRHQEVRRRVGVLFALSLFIGAVSLPLTAYWLERLIQSPYVSRPVSMKGVSVIVVLGAWVREGEDKVWYADWRSRERCRRAAALYSDQRCKIIVCGGKVHEDDPGPSIASVLGRFLVKIGVAKEDVILEENSSSTYENVSEATQLLKEHQGGGRVMLVTSASHLFRAERCFKKAGVAVSTAGSQFSEELEMEIDTFVPSGSGADKTEYILHEYLGIVWYWLKGRV